jgi:protein-S-isoprenylcysteine O-methyltransferase Ste14
MATLPENRPNRIPWPPIIYLTAVLAGLLLHLTVPLPWLSGTPAFVLQVLGAILAVGALLMDVVAVNVFRDHQTTILPHRAASHLITSGPFAWSRNPIYVGNTVLVVAAGLFFGKAWLVMLAPLAAFVTQKLAIEREERHLAEMFGEEWVSYAERVRRWL